MATKEVRIEEAKQLVIYLHSKDIKLHLENDRIKFKAPENVFTDELKEKVKELKESVIEVLRQEEVIDTAVNIPLTAVQSAYLIGKTEAVLWGKVDCQSYVEVNFTNFEAEQLKNAWIKLVQFHEMLRGKITKAGIEIVSDISALPEINELDLRGKSEDIIEKELAQIRERMSDVSYNQEKSPLFQTFITRREEGIYFHLSIDLILVDFASVQILIADLGRLLRGENLKTLSLNYKQYVNYLRSNKNHLQYEKDKKYWIERLKNFPLPPSFPREGRAEAFLKDGESRFYRIQETLEGQQWSKIKSIAIKNGITPSAAVMTAYAATINKWSENKRFLLNLPMQSRIEITEDVSRLVGDFTSLNLLEVDFSENKSFAERAKDIFEQLVEDMEHKTFSGIEVLRELSLRRGREQAFVPYVFTGVLKGENKAGKIEYGLSQTPQVWIDCQVIEDCSDSEDGSLFISWDIRRGALKDRIIKDAFEEFINILHELVLKENWLKKESLDVKELEFEFIENKNRIYIQERFIQHALENKEQAAVIDEQGEVTYEELLYNALKIAAYIEGVDKGDKEKLIAVKIPKNAKHVMAIIGVLIAGHPYLPLNLKQPKLREEKILKQAEVELVLTEELVKKALLLQPLKDIFSYQKYPSSLAYTIFTSGSTGEPKGVMMSHSCVQNTLDVMQKIVLVSNKDKILGLSEASFDLSVYNIFGVLGEGGTLVLPDTDKSSDPSHWAELIRRYRITLWNSVPAQAEMLVHYVNEAEKFNSMRIMLLSGDFIKVSLPEKLKKIMPNTKIISLGGATEAGIWSNYHVIDPEIKEYPTIIYGKALESQYMSVVDSNYKKCPVYVPGEIVIGGASLAEGYLKDEELTLEKFITLDRPENRLYRTGDRGRFLENGEIEFLGRMDNQVKINGHRIELAEIECALLEADHVKDCSVVYYKENGKEKLAAFLVNELKDIDLVAKMQKLCKASVEEYAKCTSLKVDKNLVRQFNEKIEEAIISSVYKELKKNGAFGIAGDWSSAEEIECRIGVDGQYQKLFRKWLSKLKAKDYIAEDNHQYIDLDKTACEMLWKELDTKPLSDMAPSCVKEYIKMHVDHICSLFSKEINPITFLFPKGDVSMAEDMYGQTIISKYLNGLIAKLISDLAEQKENKTKILEVGGGIGATTSKIFEKIKKDKLEYTFTDVSPFFLSNIKKKYPFMDTMLLNLDDKAASEDPRGMDIVIAAGVLNNTKDIPATLRRIKGMLNDQGILFITEPVNEHIEIDVSQVFMMPEHEDIRKSTGNCFLTEKEWIDILTKEEYCILAALPSSETDLHEFNHNLFIAGKIQTADKFDYQIFLKNYLPDIMIPKEYYSIDKMPLTVNGKVDKKSLMEELNIQKEVVKSQAENEENKKEARALSQLENEINAILKDVSKLDQIGAEDNLLQLGFDSLLLSQASGQIVNQIKKAAEIRFDEILKIALTSPYISAIAAYIEENGKDAKEQEKKEIQFINQKAFHIAENPFIEKRNCKRILDSLGIQSITTGECKALLEEEVVLIGFEEEINETLLAAGERLAQGKEVKRVILINPMPNEDTILYLGKAIIFSSDEQKIRKLKEVILNGICLYDYDENNVESIKELISEVLNG